MNQTTIPLDTIIGLCCTDGELNVPAGLLWRIPRLREAVLSAQPATIDDAIPSDVPSCLVQARRPTISIPAPFSVREWSELASHLVYGGKQTISAALLSLKNGLDLSADAMEFLEVNQGAIVPKSISTGALTAMVSVGGSAEGEESFSSSITAGRGEWKTGVRTAHGFQWILPRGPDGLSWPCLKVLLPALPAGLRWKEDVVELLLQQCEIEVGGNTFFKIDGRGNKTLAQAFGVWPEVTNSYTRDGDSASVRSRKGHMRSSKPWLVAIPILSNETVDSFLPIVSMQYSTCALNARMEDNLRVLTVGKLPANAADITGSFKVALEFDGVWLGSGKRRRVAATVDSDQPAPPPPPQPSLAILHPEETAVPDHGWTEFQTTTPDVTGTTATDAAPASLYIAPETPGCNSDVVFQPQTFETRVSEGGILRLPFFHIATGLLLKMRPVDDDAKAPRSSCPLTSASLFLNGHATLISDHADLTEVNWLKIGGVQPSSDTLLMPFGPCCLELNAPDRVSMSRVDAVTLRLEFQPQYSPEDWIVHVTALSQNTRMISGNIGIMRYAWLAH
jgi:hypothetical protein